MGRESSVTDTPEVQTSTSPVALELVDPNAVSIGENVRDRAVVAKEFAASVKEHGVLSPVTAVRLPDGSIRITDGQVRIEAARMAGIAAVPAFVRDVADDDDALRTERLVEQMVLNDHRAALTEAQRVRGINQLLLAGVSPTKVAKKLSARAKVIEAARTVHGCSAAMSALDGGQMSLMDAVALCEFDGDADAQAELLDEAGTPRFQHRLEQLRRSREERRLRAEAAQPYIANGFTVLERRPGWRDPDYIGLDELRLPDGSRVGDDYVAQTDPAAWAVWLTDYTAYLDAQGQEVSEDEIDWDTDEDSSLEPEEGLRHASTVTEVTRWSPEYFCRTAPEVVGLHLTSWATSQRGVDALPATDDPDALAAREAAQAEHDERARDERRRVRELNKLGAAAMAVRRRWIQENLLNTTPPKGAALFLARIISAHPWLF
jgi:ParB family transcriptional regulator, chromosome partitioning protein